MTLVNNRANLITFAVAGMASVALALGLAACNGTASSASKADEKVITVGASPAPHAAILNDAVRPQLEVKGWKLEVKEFTDYVLPNTATEDGELDANFFQHTPYLENFNKEKGTHLVSVAGVHIEPMRIYAGKSTSLDGLSDGATVAVPNDATNEGRALLLLQSAGVIKLSDNAGATATLSDIKENPKHLSFKEVEAATVPTVRADVDIAIINTNYALEAGIPSDAILFTESGDSPYVNVVVVKQGNESTEKTKALVEAVSSQTVRDYIKQSYPNGEVVPVQ